MAIGNRAVPRIFWGWGFTAPAIEDAAKGFAVGAIAAGEKELFGLHGGDLLGGGDFVGHGLILSNLACNK